jgi:hypothetical protein
MLFISFLYHFEALGKHFHVTYHFQLNVKVSLKTYPDPNSWNTLLPMVLLGIRTALKDDLRCTAAELVYGTNLR